MATRAFQGPNEKREAAERSISINRSRVMNYRDDGGGQAVLLRRRSKKKSRQLLGGERWRDSGGGALCFAVPLHRPCPPLSLQELVGGWGTVKKPPQKARATGQPGLLHQPACFVLRVGTSRVNHVTLRR